MRDASEVDRAVEQHGDMVRRICYLHLNQQSDAEDAFQEVFIRYLLYSRAFLSPEHEKAWLIRVTVHRCRDLLRGLRRRPAAALDEVAETAQPLPPDHEDVRQAVRELPANHRNAVYLFYFEGYPAVEIARLLGRSENTVYSWLSRARAQLRERLGGESFDG